MAEAHEETEEELWAMLHPEVREALRASFAKNRKVLEELAKL